MAVTVRIPTVLRKLTKSQAEVEVSGSDISALIDDLEAKYPGIKERICNDEGKIRRFVNIFINDEDIRFRGNETAKLEDGDVVSIVPAVAGG
ncbi:TPA: MoaD/ThiS family protein [Candidatus Poribacteria bacterium]|nr:MoaD/ThiS family protein [Candidatus Poribacteria bacterium]